MTVTVRERDFTRKPIDEGKQEEKHELDWSHAGPDDGI